MHQGLCAGAYSEETLPVSEPVSQTAWRGDVTGYGWVRERIFCGRVFTVTNTTQGVTGGGEVYVGHAHRNKWLVPSQSPHSSRRIGQTLSAPQNKSKYRHIRASRAYASTRFAAIQRCVGKQRSERLTHHMINNTHTLPHTQVDIYTRDL